MWEGATNFFFLYIYFTESARYGPRALVAFLIRVLGIMARNLDDIIGSVPATVRWKLDKEIDFEHKNATGQVIPKHLGRIADLITDWDGAVADNLDLTDAERNDIRESNPAKPKQQRFITFMIVGILKQKVVVGL